MTDPKDVPEHSLPGTQKQDGVSSGGEVRPANPEQPAVGVPASGPAMRGAPVSVRNDDDVDPMARLTEIVSQAGAQQAPASDRIAPTPAAQVSEVPQQPTVSAMPPLVAVPAIEIAAEDRPAAPPPRPDSPKGGRSFNLFRRKQKGGQDVPAAGAEEPQPVPARKGFWARRKEARMQGRQAEQHRRTARDKRWARRRRRLWLEELLGWVFVPIILIGIYYGVIGILTMLGTTPEAMLAGIKTILNHF